MSEQRQKFLRRLRSEPIPTAWDLGIPVCIDTTLHRADERLRGWFKDIRPLRGECADKDVLLYPQGFIQETSAYAWLYADLYTDSVNQCYAIPESLRSDVWSIWSRANVFSLSGLAGNNCPSEARLVKARVFETAWQRSGTEGSPPQLSESGIGWLVTLDGRLLELHTSDAANRYMYLPRAISTCLELHASDATNVEISKPDAPPAAEEPVLELPETMTSFHFEVHTKGMRRYGKQAMLGACLIACGLLGIGFIREDVSSTVSAVMVIPFLVGVYQFWCGRAGARQGQLARAVSRGLFLDTRMPSRGNYTEFWLGRDRGLLARWYVWGLVKRGVSALLVLPLGIIVAHAVGGEGPLLTSALMALSVCAVLETLVFGVVTDPSSEEWSAFEHTMLGNRRR